MIMLGEDERVDKTICFPLEEQKIKGKNLDNLKLIVCH